VKLLLLTGFLGAGKTTLLKKWLKETQSFRIGVLMNEFGDMGIDGRLIEENGLTLLEISGGSVFCACLKEDYILGLISLLSRDLDLVIVESSGMSDPSNMETVLTTVKEQAGKGYDYLGAVSIVDARYFLEQQKVIVAINRQIAYSNIVVVNKIDLQTEENLKKIEKSIHEINPKSCIFYSEYGNVALPEILNAISGRPIPDAEESINTPENRLKTGVLTCEKPIPKTDFMSFVDAIKPYTYRIKGFLKSDKGNFEVSSVGTLSHYRHWPENIDKTEVVIISSVGIKIVSLVHRTWKEMGLKAPIEFK
jgi:G3E family GTPase